MTKREREALLRKIDKLIGRIGQKRDELRKIIEDVGPLVESVEDGADQLGDGLLQLHAARDSFEGAADALSQYA